MSEFKKISIFLKTLFLVVLSTSALLREAPIKKGKVIRTLRCGSKVTETGKFRNLSDYGRWVHVKIRGKRRKEGWVLKSILSFAQPICPLSQFPLKAINPKNVEKNKVSRMDEWVEGSRL